MKADDVIRVLNENQGVVAVIPIVGGIIFWFFRVRKKGKRSYPRIGRYFGRFLYYENWNAK